MVVGVWVTVPGLMQGEIITAGGLVEGDEDRPLVLVGGGCLDSWDPFAQEGVNPGEAARQRRIGAGFFVTVGAEVRGDEGVVGRGARTRQSGRQLPQVDVVFLAGREVD